jgi:hypothetical protein
MSPNEVNARVVLPVSTYKQIMKGLPLHCVLYANNYEIADESHPIIERFLDMETALKTFRDGLVMSKGTTTSEGKVGSYFANIFGPVQYPELYDSLAVSYFKEIYRKGIFTGQIRTQLGIPGKEQSGPSDAAKALLELIRSEKISR